jgi:hypothetical protein
MNYFSERDTPVCWLRAILLIFNGVKTKQDCYLLIGGVFPKKLE